MNGIKFDAEKPDYSLIAWDALEEVVKVLSYGSLKYSRDNWKKLESLKERYLAASLRHISQYARNETNDKESGLHHLAHAIASLMFIIQNEKDLEKK